MWALAPKQEKSARSSESSWLCSSCAFDACIPMLRLPGGGAGRRQLDNAPGMVMLWCVPAGSDAEESENGYGVPR
eukprot:9231680-Pyramimonas_sp.AAC.1